MFRLGDLKRAVLGAARAAGLYRVTSRGSWRRHRLCILCYHGVSLGDEHEWSPALYFSAEQFRQRMAFLASSDYSVLPFEEAVRRLYEGTLPPRAVAITFDDGFHDFHAQAMPILREFGFPATLYLTTYYCAHPIPVFSPMCAYLLWRGRGRKVPGATLGPEFLDLDLTSDGARSRAHGEIERAAVRLQLSVDAKDAVLGRLAGAVGADWDDLRSRRVLQLMTPSEVQDAFSCGIDVQLHTHHHRTPVDEQLFRQEIDVNRTHIRTMTGSTAPVVHFCYPSGVTDSRFLPWLRAAGVQTATTCELALASPRNDPLLLPRLVDGGQISMLEFEAWLSGVRSALPLR